MNYNEFLKNKTKIENEVGFEIDESQINNKLYPFQKYIVKWSLKKGKSAIFADCGLGKTVMQLEWARFVKEKTNKPVLILAPLAVTDQTIEQADLFDISLEGIDITNYEQIDNIDFKKYNGIVLDESSILKNNQGATKQLLCDVFKNVDYKLACSATPSPNDPVEIGSHSEFLNIMSQPEMLSMFFINDGMKSNKWRLKGHSVKAFYRWMSTWAIMLSSPSDLGFIMSGYDLPELNIIEHKIETDKTDNGELFNSHSVSATLFNAELRRTSEKRLGLAIEIANSSEESFMVICKQNEESEKLKNNINGSVEVKGSDEVLLKKKNLLGFAHNDFRVLVTKSKIVQFGMNYQNCHNIIFASLDFSFETLYQAIRREWRFGQKNKVNVHIITTDTMENVIKNIDEKQKLFKEMQTNMIDAMKETRRGAIIMDLEYDKTTEENELYKIQQGDSLELIKTIKDESVGLSIFSPPFASLYTYSNNAHDLSNCKSYDEFFQHFTFLIDDLLRITKPGRLCCLHLTQLTTGMGKDGFYSIIDLRGDVIKLFQKHGWNFHAEVTIWKDPQLAAVRTKNIQLLHHQTQKDSTVSRPGLADYLICFRKPGINPEPVNYDRNGIPFELWTEYASPVWPDINPSDTLQYRSGKNENDVKHITPTQKEVWTRAITLWSNKNDIVYTPFMGIGTEVYEAVRLGRYGIGHELKESYFSQAKENLHPLLIELTQNDLFKSEDQK